MSDVGRISRSIQVKEGIWDKVVREVSEQGWTLSRLFDMLLSKVADGMDLGILDEMDSSELRRWKASWDTGMIGDVLERWDGWLMEKVGPAYLALTDKQKRALAGLMECPGAASSRVAEVSDVSAQLVGRVRRMDAYRVALGGRAEIEIVERTPELIRRILDMAIESKSAKWAELGMTITGHNISRSQIQQKTELSGSIGVKVGGSGNVNLSPVEHRKQFIDYGRQHRITPDVYRALWESLSAAEGNDSQALEGSAPNSNLPSQLASSEDGVVDVEYEEVTDED